MSMPATPIPHESGDLSQNDAIERLIAKDRAGKIPEPRTPEELLEERDPEPDPDLPADPDDENAQVEGAEFDDEDPQTTSDPLIKFDDGTELPMSEVKRGFLRQQDYTRKTQEVAAERKTVETERGAYLAEKRQISERLTPLIEQAISVIENPAMAAQLEELRVTDPGAYALHMMDRNAKIQNVQRLQHEQQQLRASAEREEAERFQSECKQAAEQSRAVLMEKIPAAKKDFATWYQGLGKWVLEQGIPAEAWDNEVDHRIVTLAWKAMQYDKATSKTPATADRLRKAPQPLRPGAAKPPGHAQQRSLREATEKAHKSGSIADMIALQTRRETARR